jgi:hypothetical protein
MAAEFSSALALRDLESHKQQTDDGSPLPIPNLPNRTDFNGSSSIAADAEGSAVFNCVRTSLREPPPDCEFQPESVDESHLRGGRNVEDSDSDDLDIHLAVEEQLMAEAAAGVDHFPATPTIDRHLTNYRNPIPADAPFLSINRRYLLPLEKDMGFAAFQAAAEELFRHPTVCIKSPMDTGKTGAYMRYLALVDRLFPDANILMITGRISLTYSLQARAKELGLEFIAYNEKRAKKKGFLSQQPRVIVQLDSLPKLLDYKDAQQQSLRFDIVLMDESESTLHHFGASSLKSSANVWNCFKTICHSSTQIICFDADLGARTYMLMKHFHEERLKLAASGVGPRSTLHSRVPSSEFASSSASMASSSSTAAYVSSSRATVNAFTNDPFSQAANRLSASSVALPVADESKDRTRFAAYIHSGPSRDRKAIHLVVNAMKTDRRRYVELLSEDRFFNRLRVLLDSRKRIVIPTNHKKTADAIACFIKQEYPHLACLYYHGESSQHMKEDAANCDTVWVRYMVVIYTPTIVYGVDFNPPGIAHFDAILAYAVPNSNVVREFVQMLGRTRKLATQVVYVYIADPVGELSDYTGDDIKEEIHAQWHVYNRMNALAPMLREEYFEHGQVKYRYNDTLFRDLFVMNLLEKKTSAKYFSDLFWTSVQERGGVKLTEESSYYDRMLSDAELVDKVSTESFLLRCMEVASAREAPSATPAAAYDPFSDLESVLRRQRIEQQQMLEEDYAHIDFHRLRSIYNLRMITVDSSSRRQRSAMFHLVRLHGQPANIDQFYAFCRINSPVQLSLLRWKQTIENPMEMPLLPKERMFVEQSCLVKGLLVLVGFTRPEALPEMESRATEELEPNEEQESEERSEDGGNRDEATAPSRKRRKPNSNSPRLPSSPSPSSTFSELVEPYLPTLIGPAARVFSHSDPPLNSVLRVLNTADLCTNKCVNTREVAARLAHFNTAEWLQSEEKTFEELGVRFTVKGSYSVKDVVSLLSRTLERVLGFGVGKGVVLPGGRPREPSTASREGGARKRASITTWRLESDRRDSMLELAYALSFSTNLQARAALGEWDVAASLRAVTTVPETQFRWQLLTGFPYPGSTSIHTSNSSCSSSTYASPAAAARFCETLSRSESTSSFVSRTFSSSTASVASWDSSSTPSPPSDFMRDVQEDAIVSKKRKRAKERSRAAATANSAAAAAAATAAAFHHKGEQPKANATHPSPSASAPSEVELEGDAIENCRGEDPAASAQAAAVDELSDRGESPTLLALAFQQNCDSFRELERKYQAVLVRRSEQRKARFKLQLQQRAAVTALATGTDKAS